MIRIRIPAIKETIGCRCAMLKVMFVFLSCGIGEATHNVQSITGAKTFKNRAKPPSGMDRFRYKTRRPRRVPG
jgi:hypothetical protein